MNRMLIMEKTNRELQAVLNDTCQALDDYTHNVLAWADPVVSLLELMEFYAMANDAYHPEQYEHMLERLKDLIAARLKQGSWRS